MRFRDDDLNTDIANINGQSAVKKPAAEKLVAERPMAERPRGTTARNVS